MEDTKLIIDFDSTFVSVEGLDELAKICLQDDPKKEEIVKEINKITDLGMEGRIGFSESLQQRLALFKPTLKDIDKLVELLRQKVTPSIEQNKKFFQDYADQIYIISGGFRRWIEPVTSDFGIPKENVLANEFIFNETGQFKGFNDEIFLSQLGGKPKQVQSMDLQGKVYVLGDGFTDYEIKQAGFADKFFVFTENVRRQEVVRRADQEVVSFDEFLNSLNL